MVTVASIYGNCEDTDVTRILMWRAMDTMHGDEGLQVIGADWNASVGEVQRWVKEDGPGWEVVFHVFHWSRRGNFFTDWFLCRQLHG